LISVGHGEAVIFGDEPLPTAWWPLVDTPDGLFIRWVAADSDAAVVQALRGLSPSLFAASDLFVKVPAAPMVLFDSAMPGSDIATSSMSVQLLPGRYRIDSALLEPDERTSLILHRFTLIA
jgi:hypothetical protein